MYDGRGYAAVSKALKDETTLRELLKNRPDAVDEVTTGGARPLHMCGMSQTNQLVTNVLIEYGANIEELDTYGYAPLHRMASNNLAIGAEALLRAGADPMWAGGTDQSPLDVARESHAFACEDVMRRFKRVNVRVKGAGDDSVNGLYELRPASEIPDGFRVVCEAQKWDTAQMWKKLNGNRQWWLAKMAPTFI